MVIEIDGSALEGGGQILRIAGSLSTLSGVATKIRSVRGKRPKPGLRSQHAVGLAALMVLRNPDSVPHLPVGQSTVLLGDGRGPLQAAPALFGHGECGAGAATLVAQTILPVYAFLVAHGLVCPATPSEQHAIDSLHNHSSPSTTTAGRKRSSSGVPRPLAAVLVFRGGTHVPFSPPSDHTHLVLLPALQSILPFTIDSHLTTVGCMPTRGGGEWYVTMTEATSPTTTTADPSTTLVGAWPGMQWTQPRAAVASLTLVVRWGGPASAATGDAVADGARKLLAKHPETAGVSLVLDDRHTATVGSAFVSATLVATPARGPPLGVSLLGDKRTSARDLGLSLARRLTADLATGSVVDEHTADQLVVYAALARGPSRIYLGTMKPSLHLTTALVIAARLTGTKCEVNGQFIEVEGLPR
mmetsp:Transcript_7692/g.24668  ORF Transcript_7692/g.24668 Transcript_7692/m.24668 type:complete len:415 (-) Transcript_7692:1961-3205(-)